VYKMQPLLVGNIRLLDDIYVSARCPVVSRDGTAFRLKSKGEPETLPDARQQRLPLPARRCAIRIEATSVQHRNIITTCSDYPVFPVAGVPVWWRCLA